MTEQGRVAGERAGAAILRAWIEPGRPDGLRVRVTTIADLDGGPTNVQPVVASIEDACAIVRRWLVAFRDGAARMDADASPSAAPPARAADGGDGTMTAR